jgi:hypothetical protein
MRKMLHLLAALGVAVSLAGCGGLESPSTQTTEDFSGTLEPLGQASKNFSVSKTGEMQVTLLSLTPRPVVGFVAVAIGASAGETCQPLPGYVVQQAAVNTPYAFPQIYKGSYCLLIADANAALTTTATWSARVSHP